MYSLSVFLYIPEAADIDFESIEGRSSICETHDFTHYALYLRPEGRGLYGEWVNLAR